MHNLNLSMAEDDPTGLTLYDRHASTLYSYIYRQVSQVQDAEDVLLEVFTIALKYENLVDLTQQQQLAWLQSVARRKIIDRYRHNARIVLLPLDQALEMLDQRMTPEEHALHKEAYEQLYVVLMQLPPLQRQLLNLRYGEELRFAEIAQRLNKPESTVRKLLTRVLRRLRDIYTHQ